MLRVLRQFPKYGEISIQLRRKSERSPSLCALLAFVLLTATGGRNEPKMNVSSPSLEIRVKFIAQND
jgi:hypothetical protein